MGVAAYGGGEAPGAFGGAGGHGFAGPGERGGGLAERQGGGVLRVQPPLGGRGGVPAQPGPGEGVLGMVEGGGEGGTAGGGPVAPHGVEQLGDGVVHPGHRVPLPVEPEVPDEGPGRGQHEPEQHQPQGTAEIGERPLPPALGQRHPGPDGGGDQQLGPGGGRDGPDGADASGEEPEPGKQNGERDGPEPIPRDRPDEQPDRPHHSGHPEPPHGAPAATGPVVDPGEHGGDGRHDPERGTTDNDRDQQQRPSGQRPTRDRTPWNGPPLRTQSMRDPGRKLRPTQHNTTHGAVHRAPVGTRARKHAFGRRWPSDETAIPAAACGVHGRGESWWGWDVRVSRM